MTLQKLAGCSRRLCGYLRHCSCCCACRNDETASNWPWLLGYGSYLA
jgi:hypothetical protein